MEISMSSEKRSMSLNAFESDVPPLKMRCDPMSGSAKRPTNPKVLLDDLWADAHPRCRLFKINPAFAGGQLGEGVHELFFGDLLRDGVHPRGQFGRERLQICFGVFVQLLS